MQIRQLHPWNLEPRDAIATQKRLACQIVLEGSPQDVRTVAGADISTAGGKGRGAVVVLSYPDLQVLESQVVESELTFPYIPGLLAFREVPVLAEAFQRLSVRPDLLLVDGQGLAHQRRFGIACHLGLLLDLPTIGCAKSRLVGEHGPAGGCDARLRIGGPSHRPGGSGGMGASPLPGLSPAGARSPGSSGGRRPGDRGGGAAGGRADALVLAI
jgi:hypothetical protein